MIFGDITEIYYMHIFFYPWYKNITDITGGLFSIEKTYSKSLLAQISQLFSKKFSNFSIFQNICVIVHFFALGPKNTLLIQI